MWILQYQIGHTSHCCVYLPLADNIVTDLLKAFLGNGSVNAVTRVTIEDVSQRMNVLRIVKQQRTNEDTG
jgi:hypothetical protein